MCKQAKKMQSKDKGEQSKVKPKQHLEAKLNTQRRPRLNEEEMQRQTEEKSLRTDLTESTSSKSQTNTGYVERSAYALPRIDNLYINNIKHKK